MDTHVSYPTSNWAAAAADNASAASSIADMVAAAANEVVESQRSALFASFVYVAEHQQWWSAEQRLYYNPANNLFYNVDTRQYFFYDTEQNTLQPYKVPAQMKAAQWTRPQFRKRTLKLLGSDDPEKRLAVMSQLEVDVAEMVLDLVERCSFLAGDHQRRRRPKRRKGTRGQPQLVRHYVDLDAPDGEIYFEQGPTQPKMTNQLDEGHSTSNDDEEDELDEDYYAQLEMERRRAEEEAAQHAPCIRLIDVTEPTRPQLHIVTITGARIGHGSRMDIQLERDKDDPTHGDAQLLSITYSAEMGSGDGGSGGYRLDEISDGVYVGINDEPAQTLQGINHGDTLTIAPRHCFSVHIHVGLNTCPECEVGLMTLPPPPTTINDVGVRGPKMSRNAERLRNLRQMKAEYGLLDKDESNSPSANGKYQDRAKTRRRHVGSEADSTNPAGGIYTKCRAAPQPGCSTETVELKMTAPTAKPTETVPIESGNKGFQLLKGMGWKEGEGLGKEQQGIQTPITSTLKTDRSGLGSSRPPTAGAIRIQLRGSRIVSMGQSDKAKDEILAKTRKRYEAAERRQDSGSDK